MTEWTHYSCGRLTGVLAPKLLIPHGLHSTHTKLQFFNHDDGVGKPVLIRDKDCGSTYPSCTDWRNKSKYVCLQPDHVPSNHILHDRSCNNCVALRPDVFEALVSWAEKFSATCSSRFTFAYSCTRNTLLNSVPESKHLLHHWATEKCICKQQTLRFIASLLFPTVKLYTLVWKRCERATWLRIRCSLWPLYFPDLTPCWFLFVGKFKVYNSDPHTL